MNKESSHTGPATSNHFEADDSRHCPHKESSSIALPTNRKPVIGLIGGIGSGKSQAAEIMIAQGGYLIPADNLGHEALLNSTIKKRVLDRFGQNILDDQHNIDRKKLGRLVFTTREQLRSLEDIVFPFIESRILEEIARAEQRPEVSFIILDAAIMIESGWHRNCDVLVFIDVPRPVRLQRLLERRGWTESEVDSREKYQLDPDRKKEYADFVVDNSAGIEQLDSRIQAILDRLGLAKQ